MKKAIIITGFSSLIFGLIAITSLSIGVLWNTPNGGLIHNLFRSSAVSFFVLGSTWISLFMAREINKN
jgi:hypothetical protein